VGAGGIGGAQYGGGSAAALGGIVGGGEEVLEDGEREVALAVGLEALVVGEVGGDIGTGGPGEDVEVVNALVFGEGKGIFVMGDVEEQGILIAWGKGRGGGGMCVHGGPLPLGGGPRLCARRRRAAGAFGGNVRAFWWSAGAG
jgi:hypothetical protein